MLVVRAVLEDELHGRFTLGVAADAASLDGAAQCAHVVARLGQVDVDRIELLHGQRPGGHGRASDASVDGRGDARVFQIDLGALERCATGRDFGLCLLVGGDRVVVGLGADGLDLDQFGIALGAHACGLGIGFGACYRGAGAVDLGGVGRGVDLIEQFAALDLGALGESPLFDDAADLRPDLGNHVGRGAPGQLGADRNRRGADFDHGHFGGWCAAVAGLRFGLFVTAGREQRDQCEGRRRCGGSS